MLSEQKKQVVAVYNQGLELYKQQRFAQALEFFKQALEIDPEDGPSAVYKGRCLTYIKNPPPPDWDGVYTMTTK